MKLEDVNKAHEIAKNLIGLDGVRKSFKYPKSERVLVVHSELGGFSGFPVVLRGLDLDDSRAILEFIRDRLVKRGRQIGLELS